ncbi:MAG: hypothetical protein ACFFAO_18175 [Candidatus Hermodarchaeota archaeon]
MTAILIKCPTCSTKKLLEIGDDIVKDTSRGITAINIGKDLICQHSFIVYIDRNLKVRDYFLTDFQVDIPEIPINYKIDKKPINKEFIDVDLIKINLNANLLAYVLKSIFSKQKIMIISDQTFLYDHIINFFQYITLDSFEIEISVISEENYKENKKNFKDSMVFEGNQIIRNAEKTIDPKKLNVEKQIINNFLSEYVPENSVLLLKNEIFKAFELAKSVINYMDDYGKERTINFEKLFHTTAMANFVGEILSKEKIIFKIVNDYLAKTYNIKVNKQYLDFILEIVDKYFKVDIEKKIVV